MRKNTVAVAAGLSIGILVLAGSGCKKSEQPGGASPGVPASSAGAPSNGASAPSSGSSPAPAGMVHDSMTVDGQILEIDHPPFDLGRVQDLFDGSKESLARTTQATTAVLDIKFTKPRVLKGIEVTTATMDINLKCVATLAAGGDKTFSQEYTKLGADPTVKIEFPGLSGPVQRLRVEITNPNGGDGHIHIRELRFL